jgi:hypothetical protein
MYQDAAVVKSKTRISFLSSMCNINALCVMQAQDGVAREGVWQVIDVLCFDGCFLGFKEKCPQ